MYNYVINFYTWKYWNSKYGILHCEILENNIVARNSSFRKLAIANGCLLFVKLSKQGIMMENGVSPKNSHRLRW